MDSFKKGDLCADTKLDSEAGVALWAYYNWATVSRGIKFDRTTYSQIPVGIN